MLTWDTMKRVFGWGRSIQPQTYVDVARAGAESTTVTVHRQTPVASIRQTEDERWQQHWDKFLAAVRRGTHRETAMQLLEGVDGFPSVRFRGRVLTDDMIEQLDDAIAGLVPEMVIPGNAISLAMQQNAAWWLAQEVDRRMMSSYSTTTDRPEREVRPSITHQPQRLPADPIVDERLKRIGLEWEDLVFDRDPMKRVMVAAVKARLKGHQKWKVVVAEVGYERIQETSSGWPSFEEAVWRAMVPVLNEKLVEEFCKPVEYDGIRVIRIRRREESNG